jgi:hypothetical protein|tara:strand:+ start:1053 stop:1265 length:213 start_codon:yes stop_codon:yes gene_type:complete
MDISSAKLPAILILVLIGVLVLQFVSNTNDNSPMIDSETCELYIQDSQINTKKYLNEFDPKCLDFKNLNK